MSVGRPPTTAAPLPRELCPRGLAFRQPRMKSPARTPQSCGHQADSSIAQRLGFRGSPTPPRPLVEHRRQGSVFVSKECPLVFPRPAASVSAA